MFKNFLDIIVSPGDAFRSLQEKPTKLLPYLVILLSIISVQAGYLGLTDYDFLIDQIAQQQAEASGVPESQIRQNLEGLGRNILVVSTVVSTFIFYTLVLSLIAGYLSLVSKFTNDGIGFKRWFSLVAWTGVPVIFTALASWVVLLTSPDGMISQTQVAVLSLNNLLFQTRGEFASLLTALDLTQIWGTVLLVLGYRQWTGSSTGKATAIAAAPAVLIFGIWALIIAL